MKKEANTRIIILGLIIAFVDQLSKLYARHNLDYIANYGAAFGILQGQKWLFVIAAVVVIGLILYYSKKQNLLAFGFILGGALGNLIDRLYFGYVVDFIDIKIIHVFNVADAANTIGAILLIIELFRSSKHGEK
ncbi:MAG TPA: signal peptidase II [Candidatus Nanoarchaeia archaeon]|nr:signal peptidase II [Candidatus Nanoarchaeia archaeon]